MICSLVVLDIFYLTTFQDKIRWCLREPFVRLTLTIFVLFVDEITTTVLSLTIALLFKVRLCCNHHDGPSVQKDIEETSSLATTRKQQELSSKAFRVSAHFAPL